MNKHGIKKSVIAIILLFEAVFIAASCASWNKAYHKYVMRGTILESSGNEIYLCIGSNDGAQVGQVFDVYKIRRGQPDISGQGKGGRVPLVAFIKNKTGAVKITEVVDEHYAKAAVVSGTAQKDSIVELAQ